MTTVFSPVAFRTNTYITIRINYASSIILTKIHSTVFYCFTAYGPSKTCTASAIKTNICFSTSSIVLARTGETVNLGTTVLSIISLRTEAHIITSKTYTLCTVQTRIRGTVSYNTAILSRVLCWTETLITIRKFYTSSIIQARIL